MVDLPNDGANKGFWRVQLRDRFGKFVEMGGAVSFEVQLPGVDGVSRGLGYFIGNASLELARISVKDNLSVPKGIYEIAPNKITAIQAIIRRDQLVENPDGSVFARSTKATPAEPLKDSMSGAEVQKKKLASITKTLKRKGRFAAPRQSNLDTWGKTSDVSVAAQEDYKQVYDSSPELQKLYDNAEDMWFRVYSLSVSTDTSSPNDLSQIPEEMKLLNREYAKHFLGLKEDGLITVYRNAVNGKDNEIDAAAGYVSTDMSLSYDYNSKKENIGANGRYEIDVKPDEVFGMLGYSQPEDEYAFVVGKGVTSQEGRVRRVGDLASLPMPAPWLDQYAKDISYARGATPYRHHALAGQFNFHEVENFGNDIKEFFAKYNLTADNIKSTFDRLYGSGAYEEYRESGNIVSFDGIRKMFVDLPNGKIGLDVTKISGGSSQGITFHSYGDASNPDSFKNDRLDNTLKMLAVFQELTGKPFFTHRSRDYVPGAEIPSEEKKTGIFQEYDPEQRTEADRSNAAEDTPLTELGFDPEQEIEVYRGVPEDVDSINPGDWVTTLPQLAKDYAGTGKVISKKVKAKDLLSDPSSGEGAYTEEMVYRPVEDSKSSPIPNTLEKKIDEVAFETTEPITEDEEKSVYNYYESDYLYINELLRDNSSYKAGDRPKKDNGEDYKEYLFEYIDSMDSAFKKSTVSEDMTVYRGLYPSESLYNLISSYKVGESFNEPAFVSVSADPKVARKFANLTEDGYKKVDERKPVLFKIKIKAGQPALKVKDYIEEGTEVLNEQEILLDRNSKFKVVNISTSPEMLGGKTPVDALVVEVELEDSKAVRTDAPTLKEPVSSILTPERAVEIWDSVLNERGAYEFDEDAADNELYDLMTEEGVSSKELAMANPVYRDYLKTLEFREKEDNSDHREWALDFLKNVRRSWNGNPKLSGLILAMQPVAKEVFGLQGTSNPIQELSSATKKEIADYTKFSKPALEAFLKASYKSTQKFFKDRGIETLVVYRGIINSSDNSYLTDPAEINVDVRPMSSWTVDPEIAKAYAPPGGILLRAEIPISQVLSTAFSGGMGTYVEREVVLLGPPEKIMGVVGSEYKKLLPGVQTTAKDTDMPGVIDVVDGVQRLQGKQSIFDKALTGEEFDLEKLDGSGQYAEDIEMFSKEEISVIKLYTEGVSYKTWNKYLRKNNAVELSKIKNDIDQLDLAIKEHGDVVTDSVVYRGNTFQSVPDEGRTDWAAILENLQVGDVLSDDAYMSTSNSPKIAYGSFAGGNAGFDYSTGKYKSNSDTQSNSLFWAITLPKGSTAMAVPDKVGFGQGAEEEVILPRGAQLRVIAIRRVEKEGEKGRYNYFLETEFIGAKPAEIELVKAPEGEGIPNVEG
jgi:hypothetical protein